jgi:hypothetical protein
MGRIFFLNWDFFRGAAAMGGGGGGAMGGGGGGARFPFCALMSLNYAHERVVRPKSSSFNLVRYPYEVHSLGLENDNITT